MNARAAGNERERIGRYPWWRRGGIVRATLTSIRTAGFRPLGGLITLQWIYYIFFGGEIFSKLAMFFFYSIQRFFEYIKLKIKDR